MSLTHYTDDLSLEDVLKLMNQVVMDLRTHRYLDVAAVTCLLYDILITIEQERALIWTARWSFGKVLYFSVRYPVAIEEIFWLVLMSCVRYCFLAHRRFAPDSCRFEAYLGIWASLIFLIPLQIVVVLRIIAIWEQRRMIAILLWFSLIATDIIALITLARIMSVFTFSMNELLRPILGCQSGFVLLNPTTSIPAFAGVIAFDTVLFVLTLAKAIHSYTTARTRLITVLFRDGFLYYCIMLALAISNTIFLSAMPLNRAGLTSVLTPALRCSYSIIGSRIILNLRSAASSRVDLCSRQQDICLTGLSRLSSWKLQQESRMERTADISALTEESGRETGSHREEGPRR